MRYLAFSCITAVLLAGCAHVPEPPTVDGRHREVVNSPATAQALSAEAQAAQDAQAAQAAARVKLAASAPAKRPARGNHELLSVYFPYNGTTFRPDTATQSRLNKLLSKRVQHVLVMARTDGTSPTEGDQAVAAARANAARDWLKWHGVPTDRITVNYSSADDYAADNRASANRARNRRVDVVVFY